MIVNFSIQNFGSIKNKQTLSFVADKSKHLEDQYIIHTKSGLRLLKMALIYGANASGKTTVLRALDFLRELVLFPADKKTERLKFQPFLFDKFSSHEPAKLSIEFIHNDTQYFYEVEVYNQAIANERLDCGKANVYRRTTDSETQFSHITFGGKFIVDKFSKRALESNTLWNNTVLGGFLKTNIDIKVLGEVVDWFINCLSLLIDPEVMLDRFITSLIDIGRIHKSNIIKILKKADLNISDIILNDDQSDFSINLMNALNEAGVADDIKEKIKSDKLMSIEFEHSINGTKYFLPFSIESLGTQRYYGLAGLLTILIKSTSIVQIDELELSLHPDLFNHFLLSFLVNAKSSQLIATTHNREILNNRDIFRDDAIWFTEKDEESATNLYSLADFDTSVIRDTSNVYNAYKIGKLGGIPNLGDYYIDFSDGE
ncbi:AAA family ATPase [Taibaiella soli]|uniref:ATP-binding protein n=1 Tax=Taibaiella soli TaxID=1649169 RepID=A0A2W2AGX6_9BACT|nr:ATP-binding protein [Taibaiella soli]PZF74745.1 ATP-binding protein [Taibaiella soli]